MRLVLEVTTVAVFAAHLLAMNLAMGGPILCIWLERRAGRAKIEAPAPDDPSDSERRLAQWSLSAFSLGLTLGIALLGLVWLAGDRPYFAAVAMIPRDRLAFAAGELAFYFATMLAYLAIARAKRRTRGKRVLGRVLAVAAASNLMAHFPPLFAMLNVLSHRPQVWSRPLDRSLYHSLLADPEVLSRVIHVWLAALATAGIAVMVIVGRRLDDATAKAPRNLGAGGARWALAASLAQLPVGLWTLMAMPSGGEAAWSGDLAGWALLGGGSVMALALFEPLAAAAVGDVSSQGARRSLALLAISVLLMAGAAHRWRRAAEREPVQTRPAKLAIDRPTADFMRTRRPTVDRAAARGPADLTVLPRQA